MASNLTKAEILADPELLREALVHKFSGIRRRHKIHARRYRRRGLFASAMDADSQCDRWEKAIATLEREE